VFSDTEDLVVLIHSYRLAGRLSHITNVRFHVLTAACMQMTVFWVVGRVVS
jgi:hypothetical protein